MELQKDNVIKAYIEGNDAIRKMLQNLYPDINFANLEEVRSTNGIRGVKTVEDACMILGSFSSLVRDWSDIYCRKVSRTIYSYSALRVICAALNELNDATRTNRSSLYMPVFDDFKGGDSECISVKTWLGVDHYTIKVQEIKRPYYCKELGLYSEKLAMYAAVQFTQLWIDFHFNGSCDFLKIERR